MYLYHFGATLFFLRMLALSKHTVLRYPDLLLFMYVGRYWEMVERLKINHFYTSPAAIRKLMKENRDCVGSYDVSSLRTIASGDFICSK